MTDWKEMTEKTVTKKEKTYLALIAVVLVAIAAVVLCRPDTSPEPAAPAASAAEPQTVVREKKTIVEVEKKIEAETLEDGLRDMGVLVTGEYYFTDVVSYSSVKKFLKTDITLPFTESSYMVRYDGVVSAGIDLSGVKVEKDDARRQITVRLPETAIRSTDIDFDSFELIEEKTGLGNPISVQDFNASMQELERSAEQKAAERGLLEKADENGKKLIRQFVGSLVDLSEYSLTFLTN